jgi:hypothetical protein
MDEQANGGWDWELMDLGGTITAPDGRTCWLQGDKAFDLHDELEACLTDAQAQYILSGYDEVCA